MIRVDYSGLNWKLVGKQVKKVHIGTDKETCLGDVYFNTQFQSHFCTTCGRWLDYDKRIKGNPKRPATALHLLQDVERIRRERDK